MLEVELWAELRKEHFVRGPSIKELMRRTGLARNTSTALRSDEPPVVSLPQVRVESLSVQGVFAERVSSRTSKCVPAWRKSVAGEELVEAGDDGPGGDGSADAGDHSVGGVVADRPRRLLIEAVILGR